MKKMSQSRRVKRNVWVWEETQKNEAWEDKEVRISRQGTLLTELEDSRESM